MKTHMITSMICGMLVFSSTSIDAKDEVTPHTKGISALSVTDGDSIESKAKRKRCPSCGKKHKQFGRSCLQPDPGDFADRYFVPPKSFLIDWDALPEERMNNSDLGGKDVSPLEPVRRRVNPNEHLPNDLFRTIRFSGPDRPSLHGRPLRCDGSENCNHCREFKMRVPEMRLDQGRHSHRKNSSGGTNLFQKYPGDGPLDPHRPPVRKP